jgi:hypothetical protein
VFSSRNVESVWNWNTVKCRMLRSWLFLLFTELHNLRPNSATNTKRPVDWPCLLLSLQFFQLAYCWRWRTLRCSRDAQRVQEQDRYWIGYASRLCLMGLSWPHSHTKCELWEVPSNTPLVQLRELYTDFKVTSVTEILKYRQEGRKEGRKEGRRSYQSYRDLVLLVLPSSKHVILKR